MSQEKKKIMAIIVASPLTQNIYDRIGAQVISNYFEVIIIDCLDWVRQYDKKPVYKDFNKGTIYKTDNQTAFRNVLKLISPSFVLDFIGRGKHTRQIQDICKEFNAIYITQLLTPSANPISKKSLRQSIISNPLVTLYKIISYILRQSYEEKPLPPDVALLAGIESNSAWTERAKKRIFTATPNYFHLQKIKKNFSENKLFIPNLPKGDYILFIDDCLAMSFDFALAGYKPIFKADEYFPILNNVFLQIENYFNMPIVIAAHPNGKEFKDYENLFGNRTVLFDITGELSLNCHFSMTHFSSAISYSVLLRKPILLLNSKKIKKQIQGIAINYIAKQLQCAQIDIDEVLDESKLSKLNHASVIESCYKTYEKNYITTVETTDSNPFESLVRHLSSLL